MVSMAKRDNVDIALQVAREARDLLGANGIVRDHASMRHMMNLKTVRTYKGTPEHGPIASHSRFDITPIPGKKSRMGLISPILPAQNEVNWTEGLVVRCTTFLSGG